MGKQELYIFHLYCILCHLFQAQKAWTSVSTKLIFRRPYLLDEFLVSATSEAEIL